MHRQLDIIDPSLYRSFCFRGEGRCNFVISAKSRITNLRIVWRLAKDQKSGMMTAKPKCKVVNEYLEKIISRFLSETYLIRVNVVRIPADKLRHLGKIPSLPHNLKIESYEELIESSKYLSSISFFNSENGLYVYALEMPDATRIPRQLAFVYGPTITIEIKPKQGFYQSHPGVDVPFCNNCVLQIEKWRSAAFKQMYDFCPLDLYCGNRDRMCSAIESLIKDPHRNLRIFVDGNVIHDESDILPRDQLAAICFPNSPYANVDTLISAIACILAGVDDDQSENFYLHNKCVLSDLLKAQRIDTIGIVRAHKYLRSLPPSVQCNLMNKSNLLNRNGLSFLRSTDARALVERYLLAATMKDCSLMVSLRLVNRICATDPAFKLVRVLVPNNYVDVNGDGYLYFAYSTRIVDLDPKSAKNLENAYQRFIAGVQMIQANPNIHKPCAI